jgi:hypothetical protein
MLYKVVIVLSGKTVSLYFADLRECDLVISALIKTGAHIVCLVNLETGDVHKR